MTPTAAADRYVLLGNHRDAWMFGAVDPCSGTAVMMEVSRVLAQLVTQQGWSAVLLTRALQANSNHNSAALNAVVKGVLHYAGNRDSIRD